MLKKLTIAGAMLVASVVTAPTAAKADPGACFLANGCFFEGGSWHCESTIVYMLCRDE